VRITIYTTDIDAFLADPRYLVEISASAVGGQ
jgi:hypothetical protein